jgi:hypothetical protein
MPRHGALDVPAVCCHHRCRPGRSKFVSPPCDPSPLVRVGVTGTCMPEEGVEPSRPQVRAAVERTVEHIVAVAKGAAQVITFPGASVRRSKLRKTAR